MKVASCSLACCLCLVSASLLVGNVVGITEFPIKSAALQYSSRSGNGIHRGELVDRVLDLRGGASSRKSKSRTASLSSKTKSTSKTVTGKKKVSSKATADKKPGLSSVLQKYKNVLPLTRIYITMIGVCTVAGLLLGEELAQGLLALDPMRVVYGMEIWRPFTAAAFLGKPSVGWLMSGYYLFEYGSSLERVYGTAQHLVFLLTQILLLSLLSAVCGLPFFTGSVITSMLHVLSRANPHEKVKWLVFTVPYWALPYGLMVADVLQAGNASAATPHILGILTGHFYHYHKFVWPKTGGEDWLISPDFLSRRLDPDASRESSKESVTKALKSRKRGRGKKLGKK